MAGLGARVRARQGKPHTPWTAETERMFLVALEITGKVRAAAEAIGRHPASAYHRRARYPDFAAAWAAVTGEQQAAHIREAGVAPVRPLNRTRHDGWTEARQRRYLRALAAKGSYAAAAVEVGVSRESARRVRRRSAEFQAACDRALDQGQMTASEAAWQRAVEGWDEPIVRGGEVVAYRRRYSDAMLRLLIEEERALTGFVKVKPERQPTPDEIADRIELRMALLNRKLDGTA